MVLFTLVFYQSISPLVPLLGLRRTTIRCTSIPREPPRIRPLSRDGILFFLPLPYRVAPLLNTGPQSFFKFSSDSEQQSVSPSFYLALLPAPSSSPRNPYPQEFRPPYVFLGQSDSVKTSFLTPSPCRRSLRAGLRSLICPL